jgi:hypothetical protein
VRGKQLNIGVLGSGDVGKELNATRCLKFKSGSTGMSATYRIASGDVGFPSRELRGLKTLGPLSFWLMCATSILLGTTSIAGSTEPNGSYEDHGQSSSQSIAE